MQAKTSLVKDTSFILPDTDWHTASSATATFGQETSLIFWLHSPTPTGPSEAFVPCDLGPQSAKAYWQWSRDQLKYVLKWNSKQNAAGNKAQTCCQWCWDHRGGWDRSPPLSSGSACFVNTPHGHPLLGDPETLPARSNKHNIMSAISALTVKCFSKQSCKINDYSSDAPL